MLSVWYCYYVEFAIITQAMKETGFVLSVWYHYYVEFVIITGATKEMGFGLTRLCMRHRHIENKIKALMRYNNFHWPKHALIFITFLSLMLFI